MKSAALSKRRRKQTGERPPIVCDIEYLDGRADVTVLACETYIRGVGDALVPAAILCAALSRYVPVGNFCARR